MLPTWHRRPLQTVQWSPPPPPSTVQWSANPVPVFSAALTTPYSLTPFVTAYNAATDVITLAPGSVSLPAWLTLPGNGSQLVPNGSQNGTNTFSGLILRVTRNGVDTDDTDPLTVTVNETSVSDGVMSFKITPSGPPNGLPGEGKHFILNVNAAGSKVYITGGDWANNFGTGTGVAAPPSSQDGRQEIFSCDFTNPSPTWAIEQYYWPSAEQTGGFLFWNPDDPGGVRVGDEYFVFRSTGVITLAGEPLVGTFNYPGSPPVGDLINPIGNNRIGAWHAGTKAWRVVGPRPNEMGNNKCWGGAYHAATNKVYWACMDRIVCATDAATGADVTPRHPSTAAAVVGASAALDGPNTCQFSIPRGFIAPGVGVDAGSDCLWVWDTANHWIISINLTKFQTWNSASGTFTAGLPGRRVKKLPTVEAAVYGGQSNTSLTYDASTDSLCVWGLTQPGYLHTIPLATIESASWSSVLRPDVVVNNVGQRLFCHRHVYLPAKQQTLAFGMIDFDWEMPEFPMYLVRTDQPSWLPDFGNVGLVLGPGAATTTTLASVMPGVGDWNWNSGNNQSLLAAWNSGAYNPWGLGKYGDLIYSGGGDGDRLGPDVYRVRLDDTITVERMVDPIDVAGITVTLATPAADFLNGPSGPATAEYIGHGEAISAPHTYDNYVMLPPDMAGNTNGAICYPVAKFCYKQSYSTRMAHKVDCGVAANTAASVAYSRAATAEVAVGGADVDGSCVVDTFNKRVLIFNVGVSTLFNSQVRVLSNFVSGVAQTQSTLNLNFPLSTVRGDPCALMWNTAEVISNERYSRRFVVMVGRAPSVNELTIQLIEPEVAGGAVAQFTPPLSFVGTNPGAPDGPGLCYVPRLNAFFMRYGTSSNTGYTTHLQKVWRIQPPPFGTNPRTGTWTVTEIVMAGATVAGASVVNGLWKRFAYAEKCDLITWIDSVTGNLYGFRPPAT